MKINLNSKLPRESHPYRQFKLSLSFILVSVILHYLSFPQLVSAAQWFGSGLNEVPGQCGEDGLKCPWYRNLARQVPLLEGCPVSDQHFRKFGNCVGDSDCCTGSYCCLAICQGITRCYNPYINKFTDNLHNFTGNPPCPLTQAPCPDKTPPTTTTPPPTTTTTTPTTTTPTTTTTTTTPTTTTTTTTPTTTTITTTTTTTPPTTTTLPTTTTTIPTTTTTTTEDPRGGESDYTDYTDNGNAGAAFKKEESVR